MLQVLKTVAHAKVESSATLICFTRFFIERDSVIEHNGADGSLNPESETRAALKASGAEFAAFSPDISGIKEGCYP